MTTTRRNLFARFPQLARLHTIRAGSHIPVVRQMAATDCGAAALAMTLRFHGKHVSLEEVRSELNPGRDGTTAETILRVARRYDLEGRGTRLEFDALSSATPGTILFWEFRHFVVFESYHKRHCVIVDPAYGRRKLTHARFRRSFTGVALVFGKTEQFTEENFTKVRSRRILKLLFEHKSSFLRVTSAALFTQIATALTPLILAAVIDQVVPHQDISLLLALAFGYTCLSVFAVTSGFIRAQLLVYLRAHTEVALALRFLDHLLELPYSYFQQHTSGDLTVRLNSSSVIREILTGTALSTLLDGTTAIVYLLLLFVAEFKIACVICTLAILQVLLLVLFRQKKQHLLAEIVDNQAASQTCQVEMLAGMETLKAMGLERIAAARWADLFVTGMNASTSSGKQDAIFSAFLQGIGVISTGFLTFYGAFAVIRGEISLGVMLAISALSLGFLQPISNLATGLLQLQTVQIYVSRLNDVLDTPPEEVSLDVRPLDNARGEITISRLGFQYSPTTPAVLTAVTGRISAGSCIGVVGRTGCGKSTLVRLLAGLYAPTSGVIRFDDADLSKTEKRSIRKQIGFVAQESHLFSGSIRHNILLGQSDVGVEQMLWAARIAELHADVMKMPMGYETLLSDRGASLSGGQRQRLALARALARRPAILILDEATSHLDAITEQAVTRNLRAVRATTIIVAHRLSTIKACDEIWVIDGGKLVERGTHETLLAAKAVYAELIDAQRESSGSAQGNAIVNIAAEEHA